MRALGMILLAVLTFSAACSDATDPPGDSPSPTSTRSNASPGAPTMPNATLPPSLTQAHVIRVVDGDTIVVDIDGAEYTVRYIGIDAPETVKPNAPVDCFGPEASAYNEQLVEGQTVGLEKDTSDTDDFGRLLRYVWLRGEMVNATLVQGGFADARRYPPDTRNNPLFESLQQDAQANRRGMWGATCPSLAPVVTTGAATPPVTTGGPCDYSGTAQAVIKGNINRDSDEKIYHVPGQNDYEQTRITESNGERWFCTESEAQTAGWRRAQR